MTAASGAGDYQNEPAGDLRPASDAPLPVRRYTVLIRHSTGPGRLLIEAVDGASAVSKARALSNAALADITILGEE